MGTARPNPLPSLDSILRTAADFVLRPALAWEALANAPMDLARMWRHFLIFGAIGPAAMFLGNWLFSTEAMPIAQVLPLAAGSPMNSAVSAFVFPLDIPLMTPARLSGVLTAAYSALAFYAAQIAIVLLTAGLIWLLAPYCQGRRNARAALALVIYGSTPLLLSAIGLAKVSFTLLLAVGMLHSCVITQQGVRRLLGAPGNDASMLLGIVAMALYVLIPVLAFLITLAGVPLTG